MKGGKFICLFPDILNFYLNRKKGIRVFERGLFIGEFADSVQERVVGWRFV